MFKIFTFVNFLILIVLINNSYSFSLKDFDLKVIQISPKDNLTEKYKELKDIYNDINNKIYVFDKNNRDVDINKAKKDLYLAKSYLNRFLQTNNKNEKYYLLKNSNESLKNSQLYLIPSRKVEARGIYLDADSIPQTKEEISKLILELYNANFNIIYPEVFRRGYSIIKNPISSIDDNFKNVNFDILEHIINESKKYNIEVHPWIWTFRVKSPLFGDDFLKKYPDLIARRENYTFEDREALFLSPSEPKARELIMRLLRFITSKYDIDGLLLDYIRFDETLGDDILTKKYFREYYLKKYNIEPPSYIPEGESIFVEWQLWREEQVTKIINQIKNELTLIKPNLKIGTAVFRFEWLGRLVKMQDWRHWESNNLINYVCPMLYTDNPDELVTWLESETDKYTRNDLIYPSFGAHRFYYSYDINKLEGVLYEKNIPGLNIFSLIHFGRENLPDLSKGIFRNKAFIPHKNIIYGIKIILNDIINQLSQENPKTNNISNLINKIENVESSIPTKNVYYSEADKLKSDLKFIINLVTSIKKNKSENIILLNDIEDNLTYSKSLVEIYIEQNQIKKVLPTIPPLPVIKKAKEVQVKSINYKNISPKIDGVIDNYWNSVESLTSFYWHTGISKPEVETKVKISHDKNNLYILFENFETDMNTINNNTNKNDSKNILNDDIIGIYFINSSNKLFHFVLNSNNIKFEEKDNNINWDGKWESQVKKYDKKWVAEVKIPFNTIELYNQNKLKGNFYRVRNQEKNKYLQWVPSLNEKNEELRFGNLNIKM